MLGNLLVIAVIFGVLSLAVIKIMKDRRQGAACAGCPYSKTGCGSCSVGTQSRGLKTIELTRESSKPSDRS